jgi:mono/diheme cytochrome c family protein
MRTSADQPRRRRLQLGAGCAAAAASIACALGLAAPGAAPGAAQSPPTAAGIEFFERNVRPVFVSHCFGCHSSSATKLRAGLRMDTLAGLLAGGDSGPAIVPGDAAQSLLVKAVRYADPDMEMPPKGKLADAEVRAIEQWVAMGAPHPDAMAGPAAPMQPSTGIDLERGRTWWAYVRPERGTPPAVTNAAWVHSPVDQFVLARVEAAGLKPAPDADKETLVRRVTFDLTGLPPTPDEVDAFRKDPSPDAYARLVDRLLASPRFGEHWGRRWLDVARYAESSGKESNIVYPHAWRYRDYVIAAFNEDKPYDVFLREQLAGDLLASTTADEQAERLVATGYLAIGTKGHNTRGEPQFMADLVDEQIDAVTQGLLATTVACARCHDHKFDPIPQRDYYAMAGIFLSTDTQYGTYRTPGNDHPSTLLQIPAGARVPNGPTMPGPIRAAAEQQLERAESDMKELAGLRDKARQARTPGSGVKLTAQEQQRLVRARSADGRSEAAADLLVRFGADGRATPANRLAMGAAEAEKPRDARLLARGELSKPGESVPRGFLQVLASPGDRAIESGSGRRELADWIASDENPLTARVWVNRVWLNLFAKGIVPTPDNFGASGVRPTDQPLLDWLAVEFMERGWSTKQLIRGLVLSHAYRMSSKADPKAIEVDPDNELLWRMPKRRLPAESIRDAMLMAAGTLQLEPPVGSPVAFLEGTDRNPVVDRALAGEARCRSVYLPVLRDRIDEMLDVFDFAEPAYVTGDRDETSVPTQALFMMNSPRVVEAARAMADRVLAERDTEGRRIEWAFRLALGRKPTQSESVAVTGFFKDFPGAQTGTKGRAAKAQAKGQEQAMWAAFCQALMQGAEFRMID